MKLAIATMLIALLLPLAASAQTIEITGSDTVRFWWEPADNAAAYEVKLIYADSSESIPKVVGAPPEQFTPRKGLSFRLSVRACHSEPDTGLVVCEGEWAEPSVDVRVCFLRSDVDCDNGVGMTDFGVLMQDWGQKADD